MVANLALHDEVRVSEGMVLAADPAAKELFVLHPDHGARDEDQIVATGQAPRYPATTAISNNDAASRVAHVRRCPAACSRSRNTSTDSSGRNDDAEVAPGHGQAAGIAHGADHQAIAGADEQRADQQWPIPDARPATGRRARRSHSHCQTPRPG